MVVLLSITTLKFADGFGFQSNDGPLDTLYRDSMPSHSSGSFKLRTPHFPLNPKPWFDVQKELSHWNEVNAKLKVYMNAKLEPEESRGVDYSAVLRKDVALSDKLDKEVQGINAAIQAEPVIHRDEFGGSVSFLETGLGYATSDWNFCSCPVGPHGTLVYPERNWPGVDLPIVPMVNLQPEPSMLELQTASMIRLHFKGKRVAIARSPDCDCVDPWEGYSDPSESSVCSVNQRTTVCLVRRNASTGVKPNEELRQEALDLLTAIDAQFSIASAIVVPTNTSSTDTLAVPGNASSTDSSSVSATSTSTPGALPSNNSSTDSSADAVPSTDSSTDTSSAIAAVPSIDSSTDSSSADAVPSNDSSTNSSSAAPSTDSHTEASSAAAATTSSSTDSSSADAVPSNDSSTIAAAPSNSSAGSSFAQVWTPFQFTL